MSVKARGGKLQLKVLAALPFFVAFFSMLGCSGCSPLPQSVAQGIALEAATQIAVNEMDNESRARHKYNYAQKTQTVQRHQYRNTPQSAQEVETIGINEMGKIFNEACREGVAIGYDKSPDGHMDVSARDYVISSSFNSTDQIWLFVFVHPSSASYLVVKDTASGEVFNKLTFRTTLNSSEKPVISSSPGIFTAPPASGAEDIRLLTFEVYRNDESSPFAKKTITVHYREGRR